MDRQEGRIASVARGCLIVLRPGVSFFSVVRRGGKMVRTEGFRKVGSQQDGMRHVRFFFHDLNINSVMRHLRG